MTRRGRIIRRGPTKALLSFAGPASLSGLYLWTKSDVGVTGAPVSNWADQSGGGRDWTAAGAARPTFNATDAQFNGLPSLGFVSPQCMVTTATLTYGAFTLFMAVRCLSAGFLYNRTAGPDYLFGTTGNTTSIVYPGGSSANNLSTNWAVSATPRTIARVFDGTHAGDILRINGVTQTLSTVSGGDPGLTGVAGTAGLFASNTGTTSSTGTMAEVILYNRALTPTEYGNVESYLRARYGYY
jgi:hypothetical protein